MNGEWKKGQVVSEGLLEAYIKVDPTSCCAGSTISESEAFVPWLACGMRT